MELLEHVEAYLAQTRIPPSTFGRLAIGDPRFVEDLRSGRRPRRRTQERVWAYLTSSSPSRASASHSLYDGLPKSSGKPRAVVRGSYG